MAAPFLRATDPPYRLADFIVGTSDAQAAVVSERPSLLVIDFHNQAGKRRASSGGIFPTDPTFSSTLKSEKFPSVAA